MSFCTNCGKQIEDTSKFCPFCRVEQQQNHHESKTTYIIKKPIKNFFSGYKISAIISAVVSVIMLFNGFDKMFNYYNGTYSSTNAYVGGDAYNYIINGTYSTSYFVLATMFALMAVGFLILHHVSQLQHNQPIYIQAVSNTANK